MGGSAVVEKMGPVAQLPGRFTPAAMQLIEDNLDGQGRIVLGTFVDPGADARGEPPIHPIAGLGEIARHDRLDDGRYNILLFGLRRIRVREVESERLYRKVAVDAADEISVPSDREPELRRLLEEAILERADGQINALPPQVTVSHLADLLTLRIPLPPDALTSLYCELDEEKRARAVLAEHEHRPMMEDQAGMEGDTGTEDEAGTGDSGTDEASDEDPVA